MDRDRQKPARRADAGRSLVFFPRLGFNPRQTVKGYSTVVDADGFRPNVGIVLSNDLGQVLWARRVGGQDAWQFPQGGINENETVEEALFRELHEEVGLDAASVQILAQTRNWLHYRLPKRLRRYNSTPGFKGQKQKWFLLQLLADETQVSFDCSRKPEFDHWRWVSYWYPVCQVVDFKREVYRRALKELAPHLPVRREHGR